MNRKSQKSFDNAGVLKSGPTSHIKREVRGNNYDFACERQMIFMGKSARVKIESLFNLSGSLL